MSKLLNVLTSSLGGAAIDQISRQLGSNQNATQSAIQAALPLMLKAFSRNTQNEQGASSLFNALQKDHDGSVLDDLTGTISNFQNGPGAGILKHVLGGRRNNAENFIGQSSGLDAQRSGQLLEMLAPVVMGAMGREQRNSGLDAGGLANLVQGLNRQNNQSAPQEMGIISKLLDKDGDGDIKDEIASVGMNFLSGLFRK